MPIKPADSIRLYSPSPLDTFYEEAPLSPGGYQKAVDRIRHHAFDRESLVEALVSYNRSIGNDALAEESALSLLRPDVYATVTGQQPGFMGGPSFTILKALTALAVAKRYGGPAIFWIASEDHDLDEVSNTWTVDDAGNMRKFRLGRTFSGTALEDVELGEKGVLAIEGFIREMHVASDFSIGSSYTKTMASFLAKLFKGTGLLFIEPKELKRRAAAFWRKEIEEEGEIRTLFQKVKERIASFQIDLPFPAEGETTLFLKSSSGKRERVSCDGTSFRTKEGEVTRQKLLDIALGDPLRLSSSVMSRPVLAAVLIPTAAAVLGPGELRYFLGLKDYFRFHGVRMPWLVPRLSLTFIPEGDGKLMAGHGVDPEAFIQLRQEGKAQIEMLKRGGIGGMAINRIQNMLSPHGKLQERVLNWFTFQSKSDHDLIKELLSEADPEDVRHQFMYLS